MSFTSNQIRSQFPILATKIHDKPLVYLDNAATTQKPQAVIDAISNYYQHSNANVHRGVHTLSDMSTQAWLEARRQVAEFFGAQSEELIITRKTTEALNLAARGWEEHVQAGDVIATTMMEHHSNFVPWQELAKRRGAQFLVLPVEPDGTLDLAKVKTQLSAQINQLKVLAITQVSNTLGTINPVAELISWLAATGRREQILVVVDAAQSAPHLPINFAEMGADMLAFSGHKIYGPMGVGGLFVKLDHLSEFSPVLFGGGMIEQVTVTNTTFAEDPIDRYTAGTPDVASLIGLAAAVQWMQDWGWAAIQQHEAELVDYAWEQLSTIPEVQLVGPVPMKNGQGQRVGSVAFLYQEVHAHDVAQVLDRYGVAVRSGHHCTSPLHTTMGWAATTRASFGVYNTKAEIDELAAALRSVHKVFYA
jgi:cysteine desulfurase/selenocysteine lyase